METPHSHSQDSEPSPSGDRFTQTVPRAAGQVAHFTFAELCVQPVGAADYMALAAAFRTVILTDVPAMSRHTKDHARR